ncbi:MAG: hypothetical protein K6F85_03010 [Bacteroidales bacterium]|nr:hypothetical protein [Bacteroidales bacterium]
MKKSVAYDKNTGRLSPILLFIFHFSLLVFAACSGGYSFTGASIPPGAKTISVKQFPNYASTVNPQLSQTLSDELRNMFASQTSLTVVDDGGDLQLSGEITGYVTRASALTSGDEVSMNRLTITIKANFVNTKDPDADFEQQFSRYRDYSASQDFSAVEQGLVSEIVTELCEDVFNKAVVNW